MTVTFTAAFLLAFAAPAQLALPAEPIHIATGSPVCVPGAILEPGSYVFAAGHPVAGQIVVDIYRDGSMELVTSALAIETSLLPRPEAGTQVDYRNTSPPCLRAWFHPAFRYGYEFVYAPDEAAAIFAASGESVPSASFRDERPRPGLIPIDHLDDRYRGGSPAAAGAGWGYAEGPLNHLALARVSLLAHLPQVPPDVAARLKLLNRLIAQLSASYVAGDGLAPQRLRLAQTAIDNVASPGDAGLSHVLERVRERLRLFAESIR